MQAQYTQINEQEAPKPTKCKHSARRPTNKASKPTKCNTVHADRRTKRRSQPSATQCTQIDEKSAEANMQARYTETNEVRTQCKQTDEQSAEANEVQTHCTQPDEQSAEANQVQTHCTQIDEQ